MRRSVNKCMLSTGQEVCYGRNCTRTQRNAQLETKGTLVSLKDRPKPVTLSIMSAVLLFPPLLRIFGTVVRIVKVDQLQGRDQPFRIENLRFQPAEKKEICIHKTDILCLIFCFLLACVSSQRQLKQTRMQNLTAFYLRLQKGFNLRRKDKTRRTLSRDGDRPSSMTRLGRSVCAVKMSCFPNRRNSGISLMSNQTEDKIWPPVNVNYIKDDINTK